MAEFTEAQQKHARKVAEVVLQHCKQSLPPELGVGALLLAAGILAAETAPNIAVLDGCEEVVKKAFEGHTRGSLERRGKRGRG